jgi:predicted small lipoprotein YifL
MSRAVRLSLAMPAALAAFALLASCGQRGPLTLSESQRPIQRLDKGATAPESPPPTGAPGTGAPTEPLPAGAPGAAGATPRPEDDERNKK